MYTLNILCIFWHIHTSVHLYIQGTDMHVIHLYLHTLLLNIYDSTVIGLES